MKDEEVLRSEGQKVADRWGAYKDFGHYEEFIQLIKDKLTDFYTPLNKSIFLDEVHKQMAMVLAKHQEKRAQSNSDQDTPYARMLHKVLFYLQQEINELPKVIHENENQNADRKTVFISYSHLDEKWLRVLERHFKPLADRIDFWDDGKIKPGQLWESEIKAAIGRAKVALLLLSADFFNSDFITKKEIPPLLEAASQDGATILFIVLKPCMLDEYPQILKYQGVNAPSKPFIRMSEADREDLCVSLVTQIRDTLG